jgi:peptidoglycan/xylan/chitin deacetylase (PgdA/CDA1 family)
VFDDQQKSFRNHIARLTKLGRFVSTDTVIDIVSGTVTVKENLFHISFDDGFKNVLTNALPVLNDYGVCAAFFVPTLQVQAADGSKNPYATSDIEMATWDDLGRAAEKGLEIGSHTRTHARFSDISNSPAAIEDEILGSKADIEENLGRPCRYISWPYGRLSDADPVSLQAVERAGYAACFGAYRGRVEPGSTDRFAIPRHHFEANWPVSHVRFFANGGLEGRAR